MAEAILKDLIRKRNDSKDWLIESAATSRYHIGDQPDDRCIETLEKHGIQNFRRKLLVWVFVFDGENKKNVEKIKPSSSESRVLLLRDFDTEKDGEKNPTVIDPYWHEDSFFELCYQQCERSLKNFISEEY